MKYFHADVLSVCVSPDRMYYKVCEYDQEMSKSQTGDHSRHRDDNTRNADYHKTIKDRFCCPFVGGGSVGVVISFLLLLPLFVGGFVFGPRFVI